MRKFNLLDEPWISVVINVRGDVKEVSLKDVFRNAHLYLDLAGDTKTQDFAVIRVILAVMHTVFSRFNAKGEKYDYFELDERFRQIEKIDDADLEDYSNDLYKTWLELWEDKKFPEVICEYLEKWRDRFYLFDDEYPFMQVRKGDISNGKINKKYASKTSGKNINRLISESENKIALFSPKYSSNNNKEKLTESEIARWLITFQGYAGLSDKAIFGKDKYKSSKGWLFDLGGIYLKGRSLYETLLLSCVLGTNENGNIENIQVPCWELESDEVIKRHFNNSMNNISSLYTAWSRGIYIDSNCNSEEPFVCSTVKLPDLEHRDAFIEPMTIWKYNADGGNRGIYTPRKHQKNKSMWRSFGLITLNEENYRKPGIIEWFDRINRISKRNNRNIISHPIIVSVSMQDDGNATSWVPVDEIVDFLSIEEFIITDQLENGWVLKINEIIEKTKELIETSYKEYIKEIKDIRCIKVNSFENQKVEDLYFRIDNPFRKWLSSIQFCDRKERKTQEWYETLYSIMRSECESIIKNGTSRDYMGIIKGGERKKHCYCI